MAEQTIGEQEQERAFRIWANRWWKLNIDAVLKPSLFVQLHEAFRAGVEHGLELRGCCQDQERG